MALARGPARSVHHYLSEPQAWARLEAAQLDEIQPLVHDADGHGDPSTSARTVHISSNVIEALRKSGGLSERSPPRALRDVVLAAIAAGRAELLRMHRGGLIHDKLLHSLEREFDLQEITALHARG